MLCTTPACFSTFFNLLWSLLYLNIPNFLVYLFVNLHYYYNLCNQSNHYQNYRWFPLHRILFAFSPVNYYFSKTNLTNTTHITYTIYWYKKSTSKISCNHPFKKFYWLTNWLLIWCLQTRVTWQSLDFFCYSTLLQPFCHTAIHTMHSSWTKQCPLCTPFIFAHCEKCQFCGRYMMASIQPLLFCGPVTCDATSKLWSL